jgi:hypothetical protein
MIEQSARLHSKRSSMFLGQAAEELLGTQLSARFFGSSNSQELQISLLPDEMAVCTRLLETAYGSAGGRGLALRIGRAAFKYALNCFGDDHGLRSLEFRLLPAQRRLETGLRILSQMITEETGDRITIENEPDCWVWRQVSLAPNHKAPSGEKACYIQIGLLQEFLSWAGGGRFHKVVETSCRAAGNDSCLFRIDKKALD